MAKRVGRSLKSIGVSSELIRRPHSFDVCGVLTEQKTARGASNYWAVLRNRLLAEGADEVLTNCKQLKMCDADPEKP